jgi:hypothetical protein
MADVTNVKMGVCSITYNGVDLGHTKGGVEVTYEPEYADVTVDAYGNTPVDKKLIGEKLTAKVPLAESTIANMRVAMPQGEFAGAANKRMTLGHKSGQSAYADAAQLVLHPVAEGTRVNDVVMHKAVAIGTVTLAHMIDDQKVIEVEFEALIDETKSDGNYLGMIGDST